MDLFVIVVIAFLAISSGMKTIGWKTVQIVFASLMIICSIGIGVSFGNFFMFAAFALWGSFALAWGISSRKKIKAFKQQFPGYKYVKSKEKMKKNMILFIIFISILSAIALGYSQYTETDEKLGGHAKDGFNLFIGDITGQN